ncbi:unnamed protein product [Arabis nemorensis]|uniref:Uncharacterized protein n=1 Tax=Arabis nemorensis TaxID=586526 RepID=A0A565CM04_9BRAS|nr:unnamed protein product [Arabis nemorensis]
MIKKKTSSFTYEMPQWMDNDGKVKPVPIHIRDDGEMDTFMAMRVDLHELKFYVVPLPKHMTLQIDDFSVIPVNHGFAYAELVKGDGKENSGSGERVQSPAGNIVLIQPRQEKGDTRKEKSIAWLGDVHHGRDSGALYSGYGTNRYAVITVKVDL